ncbi:MAG: hypothetical protein IE927_09385 [Rhodobacterales bacterium]|nr:hypothetical protein [Rhodobacterales bacterium]
MRITLSLAALAAATLLSGCLDTQTERGIAGAAAGAVAADVLDENIVAGAALGALAGAASCGVPGLPPC